MSVFILVIYNLDLAIDPCEVNVADNETSTKQIHALTEAFESSEYEQKNRSLRNLASVKAHEDVFDGYSQPTLAVQLKVLMWRTAVDKYRDKFVILLQLQKNVMMALIFGFVFLRVPRRSGSITTFRLKLF